jgi:hypothetical protein
VILGVMVEYKGKLMIHGENGVNSIKKKGGIRAPQLLIGGL